MWVQHLWNTPEILWTAGDKALVGVLALVLAVLCLGIHIVISWEQGNYGD